MTHSPEPSGTGSFPGGDAVAHARPANPSGPHGRGLATVPAGYRIGEWEVTDFIAAGSWGTVYAARRAAPSVKGRPGDELDKEPGEAALKFFSTAGLAPRQARLLAETADREVAFSRTAAHPHLIRVYGTAVISDPGLPGLDGTVVMIMERASRSLLDVLNAPADVPAPVAPVAPAESGTRTPGPRVPYAGALLVQIAQALAHLHTSGWIHGDLKPGNVLLMADDSVRLADFGLVSRIEGTHGYAPPAGSPDYLPPERSSELLSERGVATRPSLDVWALGVTAHQLLTGGALPFPGSTAGARTAAMHEYGAGRARLRLAPELPAPWHAVIADCLTADPVARAAHTMDTLLPRIEAAAAQAGPPRRGRRRILIAGAAAVALAAAGAAAIPDWSPDDSPAAPPVAAVPLASVTPEHVRVFNIDGACKTQTERIHACSLGLALDPHRKYDATNVVKEPRVYHGDTLTVDCVVNDGDRVEDETHIGTPRWFRVLLADVPGGHAWLPAVRTHDEPQVPVCPAGTFP